MSDGFRAHPDGIGDAAKKAHEHADRVEAHSSTLAARTGGRSLGRGKFGRIVDKAVRPIVDSMIHDMGKAMAKGHRSIGHGLEITKKNVDDAEHAITRDMGAVGGGAHHEGAKGPGTSLLGRDGLNDAYRRRVDERVDELGRQGHGPGRHLNVSDDQLKARLGTPIMQKRKIEQPPVLNERGFPIKKSKPKWVDEPARDDDGYVSSHKKVDPLHGPGGPQRPENVRYDDFEAKDEHGNPLPHSCEKYSSAFKDNESFLYAEQHARGRLDPNNPGPQTVDFDPADAWGPGDHGDRFRGYYIDPANPIGSDGSVNYRDVDFKDAKIKAVYEPDGSGGFRLKTMFPVPSDAHNRP